MEYHISKLDQATSSNNCSKSSINIFKNIPTNITVTKTTNTVAKQSKSVEKFYNDREKETDLCFKIFSYDLREDELSVSSLQSGETRPVVSKQISSKDDVIRKNSKIKYYRPQTAPSPQFPISCNNKKENNSLGDVSQDNLIISKFLQTLSQAVKLQKLFIIGNKNKQAFPSIRKALTSRGWIEKWAVEQLPEGRLTNSRIFECVMNSFRDAPANFIWVHDSIINYAKIPDSTIVSRFPKQTHFTTKVGLCQFMDNFHWFYKPEVSKTIFPKTFRITNESDVEQFTSHYGLSACLSLLKTVVDKVTNAESDYFFRHGKVPISIIDFANAQCSEYILCRQHDDIDRQEQPETTAKEWEEFLSWFYMIAHEDEHFQTTPYPMIQGVYSMSKTTLKKISPFWPQMEVEGCRNLWIVKPPAAFCGRNVKVIGHLDEIISHMEKGVQNKISLHIVQKYIERPLLIYNTKFDIRQWFLVTSVYPLIIWIYKDCYLRFSSQLYSLSNLDRSIHLTNNAIQCHCTNSTARHPKLPQENMWHCQTFQEYLRSIDEPGKWEQVILPGIKQGIVGAVLAAQEEMIDRPNSF